MYIFRGNTTITSVAVKNSSYTSEEINGAHIAYIEFDVRNLIDLKINDSIRYDGEEYYLRHKEDVTKEETSLGFSYRVKLYHEMYRLHDVVVFMYDTPEFKKNFNRYNGTARQVLDIVVRSMNRLNPGWSVGECIETKSMTFDLKDKTCAEALNDLIGAYNSEFHVKSKRIYFGKRELAGSGRVFSQGFGGGFRSITLSSLDDTPPITRLFAYGSDKNMTKDDGYYVKLPGGVNYLEKNVDKYGVIEAIKQFEEVYPHGTFTVTEKIDDYTLRASGIDFDIEAQLIDGVNVVVTFQDGGLAGYDLDIAEKSWDNATKEFRLKENKDEDALKVPGDIHFAVGDKFILTGLRMPQAYIDAASQELQKEAQKYLDSKCENMMRLQAVCDEIFFAENLIRVDCGELLHVKDDRLGIDRKIRVVGVKKYIEDEDTPYRYDLTLSDFLNGSGFMQTIREIAKDNEKLKQKHKDSINYTRRHYRDIKAMQDKLKEDFQKEFGESINPVTIETMQLIVGHEQLQFVFVDSKTKPQNVVTVYPQYANDILKITNPGGVFLKHMTLGIKEVSSKHDETKYRYWAMSDYTSPALNKSKVYRLYARVEASGQNGTFRLSETKIEMNAESGYYHFLMGYLGSESEGARSWGRCYGFTEILPGQITTEIIQDPNARLVIDLVQGTIKGPVTIMAGSTGYENLTDKPNLTVYKTKAEFNVFANQISGQVSQINTKLGGTESELNSLNTWTRQKISQVETGLSGANDNIYALQTAGFITTAQGNALYASAQDMNGNKLVSLITQTPTAISLLSRNINLSGNVTFTNFQSSVNNSLANKPNKSELGNLAYKSMVSKAQLDSTIIDGGFIKTSLIDVNNLVVNNVAFVGDFKIAGGSLLWKDNPTAVYGNPVGTWLTARGSVRVLSEDRNRFGLFSCYDNTFLLDLRISNANPARFITCDFSAGGSRREFVVEARNTGDADWYKRICIRATVLPHKNAIGNLPAIPNSIHSSSTQFWEVLWDARSGCFCLGQQY